MKQSPRSGKTPAKLSEAAVRRLNSYALVAGAAGVGMLAQPAEAKIVYTPAHLKIVSNPTGIYNLDLNHDGVNDFAIRDMTFNTGDFIHGALLVDAFGKNAKFTMVGRVSA